MAECAALFRPTKYEAGNSQRDQGENHRVLSRARPGPICYPMSERKDEPAQEPQVTETPPAAPRPKEIGGPKGPEPTRYGDWEVNGRCSDF